MRHSLWMMVILLAATITRAQPATQPDDPTARTTTRPATTQARDKGDRINVTQHKLTVGSETLKYTASAGTMVQRDESGAAKADMFFVAYTLGRPDDTPPSTRPITFIFNGGPGAASVWLHLGTAGPKRINLNDS